MFPVLSEAVCKQLTPLIRAQYVQGIFGLRITVSAVTEDSVLRGRCRGSASLVHVSNRAALNQCLKRVREVPLDEITSIEVRRGGRRTRQLTARIKSAKQSLKLRLPYDEAEHFLGLLQTRLGERISVRRGVPLHGWKLNLFLLFAIAMVSALIFSAEDWMAGGSVFAFSVLPLLLVQIYDHLPAPFPWEISAKKKPPKPVKDRSGVEPYRSKPIGWALKICAVLMLIGLWFIGLLVLAPIALVLLYVGNQIASVPPKLVRQSDSRKPILYLRSFLDDRITNLTPDTGYAIALGVMPPRFLPTPWRYLFYFHPVRVLRILFGAGVDTSEEQLALFFRKLGPFVAIGRPGERFASPGASRMYVTNDEWQNVVLEHLKSSQIVLLQPAKTEGIWWEVEKTIGHVDPRKVLLCMVNFHRRQNDYEKFRMRAEKFLSHSLPRNLAFTQTAAFIYFDDNWNSVVQEVSCRAPMIWPVVGNPVDLRYTLEPFLNSANVTQQVSDQITKAAEESATSGEAAKQEDSPDTSDQAISQQTTSPADEGAKRDGRLLPTMLPRAPRGISRGAQLTANVIYLGAILMLPMVPLLITGIAAARRAAQRANAGEVDASQADLATADVETLAMGDGEPLDEAGVLKQQGLALTNEGKLEPALAELTKSIEINSSDPQSFVFRGDVLESMQRREEAIKDYEQALQLEPEYVLAWNNLGYAHLQMGKFEDAAKCFSKAIELNDKDASFFANRGVAFLSANQFDPAIADFGRSLEIDSQQPHVYYLHGKALAAKEQWVEAIKYYNTAIQLDPNILDAYFFRGSAFVAIGEQKSEEFNPYDFARRDFSEFYKRSPQVPRILLDLAGVNRLDGKLDDAIADVSKFLELVPGDEDAVERRMNFFIEANRYDESLVDLESLLQTHPNDASKLELRASMLFVMKRFDEAIAQADSLIAQHPDSVSAFKIRGNCLYQQRRYQESLASYADALEIDPQDAVSLTNRAQIFAVQNHYDQCAAEYQKLVDAHPDQFDPHYFLLYAFAATQQWSELNDRRALLIDSFQDLPNPQAQMLMARVALLGPGLSSFDWSAGLALLTDLCQANPDNQDLHLLLGAYQFQSAQFKEAEETLNIVLKVTPEPKIIAAAQLWLCQTQSSKGLTDEAEKTFALASAFVQDHCSLDIEQEQAKAAEQPEVAGIALEWRDRVELRDWLAIARAKLDAAPRVKKSSPGPNGEAEPSEDRIEKVQNGSDPPQP